MPTHHHGRVRVAHTPSERIHEVDGVLVSRHRDVPAPDWMFTTQPRHRAHRSFTATTPAAVAALVPWRSLALTVLAIAIITTASRAAGTPAAVAVTAIFAMAICGIALVVAESLFPGHRSKGQRQ